MVPGLILTFALTPDVPTAAIGLAIAQASVPIGLTLGWLLAPSASQPGMRSAIGVAAWFALIAVVVGAFLAPALVPDQGSPGDPSTNAMTLAVFGLAFFGVPMFVATFGIALVWVGALRYVTRPAPSARPEGPTP